jgi:glycosyltransferase involved in cell wall biosynthesis
VIQVFILTHNRPHFLSMTVDSVLSQSNVELEVIVSDNSSNDSSRDLIQKNYSTSVKYRRRIPGLQPIEHFNVVLSEVESDYFMMFHDDDIMHPNMAQELSHELIRNDKLVAVGANARFLIKDSPRGTFGRRVKNDVLLEESDSLIERYLEGKDYFVPFPSYMYRRIIAQRVRLEVARGGKYADVSFLIDVSRMGFILMKSKPLMDYRVHEQQDSQDNSFLQRIALMNYISSTTSFHRRHRTTVKFRIRNIYDELWMPLSQNAPPPPWKRILKIVSLTFHYSPFNFFPKLLFRLGLHFSSTPLRHPKRHEGKE